MSKLSKHNSRLLKKRKKRKVKLDNTNKSCRMSCKAVHIISGNTEQERKANYFARHSRKRDENKKLLNEHVVSTSYRKVKRYKVFDKV